MSHYDPPPPQTYANAQTVLLADQLLPLVLVGKTKAQIVEYLTTLEPPNQLLVDQLRQFCNYTYRYQINRNRGLNTLCNYQILWENVGSIPSIDPRNMWNMNYLLFTIPDSGDLSNFIFAVLYVVKWNLNNYLDQTLLSQGLSYCGRIIN